MTSAKDIARDTTLGIEGRLVSKAIHDKFLAPMHKMLCMSYDEMVESWDHENEFVGRDWTLGLKDALLASKKKRRESIDKMLSEAAAADDDDDDEVEKDLSPVGSVVSSVEEEEEAA